MTAGNKEVPAEVREMQEEMERLGPREWLKQFNLKRWRKQADLHFGPGERAVVVDEIKQPTNYELKILGGLQTKSNMFAGIDTQHATKPLKRNLDQRRKRNKMARRSRAANR